MFVLHNTHNLINNNFENLIRKVCQVQRLVHYLVIFEIAAICWLCYTRFCGKTKETKVLIFSNAFFTTTNSCTVTLRFHAEIWKPHMNPTIPCTRYTIIQLTSRILLSNISPRSLYTHNANVIATTTKTLLHTSIST